MHPRTHGWLRSWLLPITAATLCVTADRAPAWAGGSTGSTGGDATTGSTGGSADTSSSTTSSDDGIDGDVCGDCMSLGDNEIVSPMDGAVVTSPFEVRVVSPQSCYCDTCGCFEIYAEAVAITVDFDTIASCDSTTCVPSDTTFELDLSPGTYVLRARTDYEFSSEDYSPGVTVTVEGAATNGTAGPTEGGGATEPAGCGCSADGEPDPFAAAWVVGLWGFVSSARTSRRRPTAACSAARRART